MSDTSSENGAPGGGGFLSFLSTIWPALNRSLQTNDYLRAETQKMNYANQGAQLDLANRRDQMTQLANIAGGYDPSSGITWNTGSADPSINPLAAAMSAQGQPTTGAASPGMAGPMGAFMQDPVAQAFMRIDRKGTLGAIAQRMFAPPTPYQVKTPDGTVKSMLLTMPQAAQMQSQGYEINEEEKAKPIDQNQAPTIGTINDAASGRAQPTFWRPGMAQPTPYGGLGGFTMPAPAGDIGGLLDSQRYLSANGGIPRPLSQSLSMGGGTSLGAGSGSPPAGGMPPPAAPDIASGSSGIMNQPGAQPANAGGQNASASVPGMGANPITGGIPSLPDIIKTRMQWAAMNPAQQAAQTKAAEITAGQTTPQPMTAAKDEGAMAAHIGQLDLMDKAAQDVQNAPGLPSILGVHSLTNRLAFPGGDANDALRSLDFLKNRSILTTFQAVRDASTTGGGVGQLREMELPIFENAQGMLDTSQSPEQFKRQLSGLRSDVAAMKSNAISSYEKQFGKKFQYRSQSDVSGAISAANDALAKGAPRNAVEERLIQHGIDPRLLQ